MARLPIEKKYEITPRPEDPEMPFVFTGIGGKYKKMIWQYGNIKFDEDKEHGQASVKFDYYILDNPKNLTEDQKMVNFLGDVLVDVIDKQLQKDELYGVSSEDRGTNPESTDGE
tara:strand:+ start:265 stop:606 length:342 start_codon:yes stop_codon:yes gene_type:complete